MRSSLQRRLARKRNRDRIERSGRDPRRQRLLQFEPLEERRLLAGLNDSLPDLLDATEPANDADSGALPPARRELVVVDAATPDYARLLAGLDNSADAVRRFETVIIDSNQDGLDAVGQYLQANPGFDAVHVISHGRDGEIQLGNVILTNENLDDYTKDLTAWSTSLDEDADLLIYGCDVAGGTNGQQLISSLGELTGADVAASSDVTGDSTRGGDWDLE